MNPHGVTRTAVSPALLSAYNAGVRAARMANDEVAADYAKPGCVLCPRPYDPASPKGWRRLRAEPGDRDVYHLCQYCFYSVRKDAREEVS